jgi:S1-C subfamily serine protease
MRRRLTLWIISVVLCITAWSPTHAQPQQNPLDAVVRVKAEIKADARTRNLLGLEREGSGIVIDDSGLVLTIGFLVLEAESVTVTTDSGQEYAATVLAYHSETGLGLLRTAQLLDARAIKLGKAADLQEGEQLLVGGFGGPEAVQPVIVTERRTFTGQWEYLLDAAIFTAPAHPNVAGAGLFAGDGTLLGIGYLTVGQRLPNGQLIPGNMFVPIDALRPILGDLITVGRSAGPPRPWLGLFLEEERGRLFVDRTALEGPADTAGLRPGDIVLTLDGADVGDRAAFYRSLWQCRQAGASVNLGVLQGSSIRQIPVASSDRYEWYKVDPKTY